MPKVVELKVDIISSISSHNALSLTTGIIPTEQLAADSYDELKFKKYILRRNNEDSVDDSREFEQSNKLSPKKTSIIYSQAKLSKRRSSFAQYANMSPKKQNSHTQFQRQSSNAIQVMRAPSRAIGRSIIYGDTLDKKSTKNIHPLSIFVRSLLFREPHIKASLTVYMKILNKNSIKTMKTW